MMCALYSKDVQNVKKLHTIIYECEAWCRAVTGKTLRSGSASSSAPRSPRSSCSHTRSGVPRIEAAAAATAGTPRRRGPPARARRVRDAPAAGAGCTASRTPRTAPRSCSCSRRRWGADGAQRGRRWGRGRAGRPMPRRRCGGHPHRGERGVEHVQRHTHENGGRRGRVPDHREEALHLHVRDGELALLLARREDRRAAYRVRVCAGVGVGRHECGFKAGARNLEDLGDARFLGIGSGKWRRAPQKEKVLSEAVTACVEWMEESGEETSASGARPRRRRWTPTSARGGGRGFRGWCP
ncbi:hypothetical protein DFH08DRAFT_1020688 [Mycena albidolilacea]|uniref:Uncharacterized protein n=1 Tax=Mycena albidolilacea TaxID=1033008 RepID=A0AAD6ZPB6_9AGAR|nr:hypothetical protein DFH08DRAFT_1020688 [Mycena albidolilacea]